MSTFDEALYEDDSVNRMVESMQMFKEISNNKNLQNTPILIFFNKSDLFREKLANGHELSSLFPEYTGKLKHDEPQGGQKT